MFVANIFTLLLVPFVDKLVDYSRHSALTVVYFEKMKICE